MKKVYIIHKWSGTLKSDWYPWLKKELEAKGFKVIVPAMPNPDKPIIEERVSFLKKLIPFPDEGTIFIGHSIGCQTIMRYLESLPDKTKVGQIVFVAGWFNLDNLEDKESREIAKPWIETPINSKKIKRIAQEITVFLSSNEPYGFVKENSKIFKEKLGAKVIILKNKGHFTKEDGITIIPELLDEI